MTLSGRISIDTDPPSETVQPVAVADGSTVGPSLRHREDPVRELGARASARFGWLRLNVGYDRWFADADRLRRGVYELMPLPNRDVEREPAVHAGTGGIGLIFKRLRVNYATDYLLPTPQRLDDDVGFNTHRGALVYKSACDCWDLIVRVGMQAEDPWETIRADFLLNVGGYDLGSGGS